MTLYFETTDSQNLHTILQPKQFAPKFHKISTDGILKTHQAEVPRAYLVWAKWRQGSSVDLSQVCQRWTHEPADPKVDQLRDWVYGSEDFLKRLPGKS